MVLLEIWTPHDDLQHKPSVHSGGLLYAAGMIMNMIFAAVPALLAHKAGLSAEWSLAVGWAVYRAEALFDLAAGSVKVAAARGEIEARRVLGGKYGQG